MESTLSASAVSAGELFSNSTFIIPPYQREFAWSDENLKQFWEDLRDALEQKEYFLGLIVLTSDSRRYSVVDGQQRIIAITLLAAAIRKSAKDLGRVALHNRLTSIFLTGIDYATDAEVPRVQLSNVEDERILRNLIETGEVDAALQNQSSRLVEAYRQISAWIEDDVAQDPFGKLGVWAEFLIEKLMVALFVHPDQSAAYGVFEVINTRGRGLTMADLLKSFILSETPESLRDLRYLEWQEVATPLNQFNDAALVQFIRHITMAEAGFIQAKDLYSFLSGKKKYIVERGEVRPPSVGDLMEKMKDNFPLYMQMLDTSNEGPSDMSWLGIFDAFNDLGVLTVRPLLLAITRAGDAREGLEEVLRLVVRRIVVGNLGTGSVERRFAECARLVSQTGEWRSALESLDDLNPAAAEFEERVSHRSFNRGILSFLRRSQLQHSLSPTEMGTLHLIRPRQASDWEEFPGTEFTYWGSTIGNTVVADSNKRPGRAATWTDFKNTVLPQVLDLDRHELADLEHWSATLVESRGQDIAAQLRGVWYD